MAKHSINIQDGFLFQNLKEARELSIQLVTGVEIRGTLKRFDRFAVIVETAGDERLIYKHAISYIAGAAQSG